MSDQDEINARLGLVPDMLAKQATDPSWLDRGDGLPVFWDQCRDSAMATLREWAKSKNLACQHNRCIGEGSMSSDRWATSWRCLDCGHSEKFSS